MSLTQINLRGKLEIFPNYAFYSRYACWNKRKIDIVSLPKPHSTTTENNQVSSVRLSIRIYQESNYTNHPKIAYQESKRSRSRLKPAN